MDIKRFSHIMHICSTVTRQVDPHMTAFDRVHFRLPGRGRCPGAEAAPIEIIDELEPADRGIYGGTVGYF